MQGKARAAQTTILIDQQLGLVYPKLIGNLCPCGLVSLYYIKFPPGLMIVIDHKWYNLVAFGCGVDSMRSFNLPNHHAGVAKWPILHC